MNKPSSTQQDLARRLFFHSADDDYICARIAIRHALYRHFSWNAGQCLEKYTKCLCLLRGQSAKFDHKFLDHLQRFVIDADPSFFPNQLDVSAYIKVKDDFAKYAKEPLLDCLKRFQEIGNTNVRYRVSQNLVRPYDLQKLDLIVFLLRRLCVLPPQTEEAASIHEEKLRADHFYTTAKKWPTIMEFSETGRQKIEALKFENCANFPDQIEKSRGRFYFAFDQAPQAALEIVGRLNDEDRLWLKTNVRL